MKRVTHEIKMVLRRQKLAFYRRFSFYVKNHDHLFPFNHVTILRRKKSVKNENLTKLFRKLFRLNIENFWINDVLTLGRSCF